MQSLRSLIAVAALPLVSSCAGSWICEPVGSLAQLPARKQVQVWHGGSSSTLHAVRLTSDSLSGVPFFRPPSCDSCRVAIARSRIDSVRVGDPETGLLMGLGLGVVFSMLMMAVLYGASPLD